MKFISHKGESFAAPDNSMAAFRLAIDGNSDGLETDIRITADNEIICFHDDFSGYLTGQNWYIPERTYAELQTLVLNDKEPGHYPAEHIPRLAEVLAMLRPGQLFFIELKGREHRLLPHLKRLLDHAAVDPRQLRFLGFDGILLYKAKQWMPEIKTLWLAGDGNLGPGVPETLELLRLIRADGVDAGCNEPAISRKFIAGLRNAGYEFHVWTVDDIPVAERFVELGVQSITSNRALMLRDYFRRRPVHAAESTMVAV